MKKNCHLPCKNFRGEGLSSVVEELQASLQEAHTLYFFLQFCFKLAYFVTMKTRWGIEAVTVSPCCISLFSIGGVDYFGSSGSSLFVPNSLSFPLPFKKLLIGVFSRRSYYWLNMFFCWSKGPFSYTEKRKEQLCKPLRKVGSVGFEWQVFFEGCMLQVEISL